MNESQPMNAALAKSFFRQMYENPPKDIQTIEKQVDTLAKSLGFNSAVEMASVKNAGRFEIPDDATVYNSINKDVLSLVPSYEELSVVISNYIANPNLDALLATVRNTPRPIFDGYDPTPEPSRSGKKYSRRMPKPYDVAPLKEKFEKIKTGALPEDEAVNLAEEAKAFTMNAIKYWEEVVSNACRLSLINDANRREAAIIKGIQLENAKRMVNDKLDYIRNIKPTLLAIPILVAEAHTNKQGRAAEINATIDKLVPMSAKLNAALNTVQDEALAKMRPRSRVAATAALSIFESL